MALMRKHVKKKINHGCSFRSFLADEEEQGICASVSRRTRPFNTQLLNRRVIHVDPRIRSSIDMSKKVSNTRAKLAERRITQRILLD